MEINLSRIAVISALLIPLIFSNYSYSFESDYTNQIHGYAPIVESIGAVIVKKGESEPFYAKDLNDKTVPEIGDTLYVPVNVIDSLKKQYPEAFFSGSSSFFDFDKDVIDQASMALKVEWFILDTIEKPNTLEGFTPVLTGITNDALGIGYKIQPTDFGKRIAFRVQPISQTGLPRMGEFLDVFDLDKLNGQSYPLNSDGKAVPSPIVPNSNLADHPHLGSSIVGGPQEKYLIEIFDMNNQKIEKANTPFFVESKYNAKIFKLDLNENGVNTYHDVTEDLKNNLVWQLYIKNESDELIRVASTGLSDFAVGNLTDIKEEGVFNPIIAQGSSLNMRLENGTLTFLTQKNNSEALYKGAPNYSEQGLFVQAYLITEN